MTIGGILDRERDRRARCGRWSFHVLSAFVSTISRITQRHDCYGRFISPFEGGIFACALLHSLQSHPESHWSPYPPPRPCTFPQHCTSCAKRLPHLLHPSHNQRLTLIRIHHLRRPLLWLFLHRRQHLCTQSLQSLIHRL